MLKCCLIVLEGEYWNWGEEDFECQGFISYSTNFYRSGIKIINFRLLSEKNVIAILADPKTSNCYASSPSHDPIYPTTYLKGRSYCLHGIERSDHVPESRHLTHGRAGLERRCLQTQVHVLPIISHCTYTPSFLAVQG